MSAILNSKLAVTSSKPVIEVNKHKQNKHQSNLKKGTTICPECGVEVKSKSGYSDHMKRHREVKNLVQKEVVGAQRENEQLQIGIQEEPNAPVNVQLMGGVLDTVSDIVVGADGVFVVPNVSGVELAVVETTEQM